MRAKEFLNLYKRLEELLTVRYSHGKKQFSSAIIQFANDVDGKKYREEINLCREIRNLLSHHSEIEGSEVIEPSEAVVEILQKIVDEVEHPKRAINICTPADKLVKTNLNGRITGVITQMDERGYSHIPVMNGEVLYGVFSVSTMFTYFKRHLNEKIENEDRLEKFADFLPISEHSTENFKFSGADTTFYDIKDEFINEGPKSKRLAAIFVTENGNPDEKLLGMITPWDVIRENPD